MHLRSPKALKLDRALSGGLGRQILIYTIVVIATFFLLFGIAWIIGMPESPKTEGFGNFWKMLSYFYDGGLEGTEEKGRWFVYLANIIGSILMGGILIATITNYLFSNRDKAEKGLLRYRLKNHTVFIGCHESMIPIVKDVLKRNERAVVFSEQLIEKAKDMILPHLNGINTNRLFFYYGRRTELKELEALCLMDAHEVVILPELDSPNTDTVNLDVIKHISQICDGRSERLKCTAVFQQSAVVTYFERSDVKKQVKEVIEFNPVDYGDAITQVPLSKCVCEDKRLGPIRKESERGFHLFILGLGMIGRSLFTQAVRQLHFPNFERKKTTITIVGEQIDIDAIKAQYRELFAVADKSELYSYLGDFLDIKIQNLSLSSICDVDLSLEQSIGDPDQIVSIAICLEDAQMALKQAMSLPRIVYEKSIPVWLYHPNSDSLITMRGAKAFYSNFVLFGDPCKALAEDAFFTEVAKRINWAYHLAYKHRPIPDSLPAPEEWTASVKSLWDVLSIGKKWSNMHASYSIPIKLSSLGISAEDASSLSVDQIDILARVEHNRWVAEVLLEGFRPLTAQERREVEADPSLKEVYKKEFKHSDLCSYDDLLIDSQGNDVRMYDRVIVSNLHLLYHKIIINQL